MLYSKKILTKAVAPAPWYWETFPKVIGKTGKQYIWRIYAGSGKKSNLVFLSEIGQLNDCKIILNTYTRVFLIPPSYFGLWFKENGRIVITIIDPEMLLDFNIEAVPEEDLRKPYYVLEKPIMVTEFSRSLPEGTHTVKFPMLLKSIDELLVVDSYYSGNEYECYKPIYAIFELFPKDNRIKVVPQRWFTRENFDIEYEWITRAVKVPGTNKIIGDGIRIGAFELTEDGRKFSRWLK